MSLAPRVLPLVLAAMVGLAAPVPAVQDAERPRAAGTEVPAPKRTKFVSPRYPPMAQARGLRGIVILELVIDVEGKVGSVTVVRSVPEFDEAAVAAARQWEYEVTRVDGKPVPVRITVPITFAMKLPEVKTAAGIPPLRGGVTPAVAAGTSGSEAVEATVTVDPQGHVVEASITRGQPPFSDAVIGALRTWRFGAVEAGTPLSFTLRAEFVASGDAQRVTLELKDPREAEAAVAAAEPPPAPAAAPPGASAPPPDTAPSPDAPAPAATTPEVPPTAPAPAPAPATPTPAPVPEAPPATLPAAPPGTIPAPPPVAVPPAAPPSTMPPPAAPPSTMAPPTAPPSTTAPPSAPSSITPPSATPPATTPRSTAVPSRQQPPAEEVIPAAPVAPATAATTPPAVINEEGMSAIRDVTLSPGVPDLPKGRRPVVPPIARLQGVTGTVEVMFLVEGSGQTVVRDVTGPEMLREAARSTVASWSFRRLRPERLPLKAVFNYGKEIATAVVGPQ